MRDERLCGYVSDRGKYAADHDRLFGGGARSAEERDFQQSVIPEPAEFIVVGSMVTPLGGWSGCRRIKKRWRTLRTRILHIYGFLDNPNTAVRGHCDYTKEARRCRAGRRGSSFARGDFREIVRRSTLFYDSNWTRLCGARVRRALCETFAWPWEFMETHLHARFSVGSGEVGRVCVSRVRARIVE